MLLLIISAILLLVNAYGLTIMGIDKSRARRNKRRYSEKYLFMVAFSGGAVGIYLGMYWFRHKTRHFIFKLGIPLMIILNVYIIYYIVSLIQR